MENYFAPKTYRPKTIEAAFLSTLSIVAGIALGCFAGYRILFEEEPLSSFWLSFAGAAFLISAGAGAAVSAIRSRDDRLVLNQEGVFLRRRGGTLAFLWGDIQKARKFTVNEGEDPRDVVALQRKGELSYGPDQNSLDGFDVGADDLLAYLRDGQRRFGDN